MTRIEAVMVLDLAHAAETDALDAIRRKADLAVGSLKAPIAICAAIMIKARLEAMIKDISVRAGPDQATLFRLLEENANADAADHARRIRETLG